MKNNLLILISIIVCLSVNGCVTTQPRNSTIDNKGTLTLGTVQKYIKNGISQTQVITTLGSPNIVTNDGGNETWVYDKISTVSSANEATAGIGAVGASSSVLGGFGVSDKHSISSTTQKTLTVIIKFDNSNNVTDVLYHTSKY